MTKKNLAISKKDLVLIQCLKAQENGNCLRCDACPIYDEMKKYKW